MDRPQLESALASFARYYMGNDDPEGMASDLLLILDRIIDVDQLQGLAQQLEDEVSDAKQLDAEDEPDWLTNPCSTMARCHY
ncbi:hypothetical protein [uncultured Oceanicoccus sp.]|uniref:hypothetical protein n=1 Tax=uncultured Oceanicoccus sp. TaxID=1706381 RepID=UPI0030DB7AD1